MFERLAEARGALKEVVASLDPETLEGATATQLVEQFASIERLAAAGVALCAKRVADSGAWRHDGDRSPARWMARTTGTSVGSALGVLETAEQVSRLPATETALRSGELSEVQAKEIVSAAAASPAAEPELLNAARTDSVWELKERCARVRAAAGSDELDRHEAIRKRRRLRHFRDPDGAFHLDAVLTPDAGAVVMTALEPYTERIFQSARRQGRHEAHAAYAADALVELAEHARACDDRPSRRSPGATIQVLVDHRALLRGSLEDGESCEIPGIGPIPVATARALAEDAFLSAIVTDGTDIKAVSHLGRTIPSRLRTAIELRDRCCVVPGCDVAHHLEIDHIRPRAVEDRCAWTTSPGCARGTTTSRPIAVTACPGGRDRGASKAPTVNHHKRGSCPGPSRPSTERGGPDSPVSTPAGAGARDRPADSPCGVPGTCPLTVDRGPAVQRLCLKPRKPQRTASRTD